MNALHNQTFSFRDFYTTLFRRKKVISISFLSVMLAIGIYVICAPSVYRSRATLIVNLGRESVTLDPTATTGKTIPIQTYQNSEINSEAQILRSSDLADDVVNTLGANTILYGSNKSPVANGTLSAIGYWTKYILTFPFRKLETILLRSSHDKESLLKKHDYAVKYVQKHLSVDPIKKSNIISIDYETSDPQLAQTVVKNLITAFEKKHLIAHQTPGSYPFFVQQQKKLQVSLENAENKLRLLKDKTGIASISEQKRILLQQLGKLQKTLGQQRADKASTGAKIRILEHTLANLPPTLRKNDVTGFANSSYDEIQKRVYELKLKKYELLSKYKKNTPPIIEIDRQIKKGQLLLSKASPLRQIDLGINKNYQKFQFAFVTDKSHLSATNAKIAVLLEQISEGEKKLKDMNSIDMQINRLARVVAILRTNYIKYSESKEQARIDQALKMDNISDIRIVQPASYSMIPVRPRRKLILALGLLLALFGSIGAAFFIDHLDHTLRDIDEINLLLDVPVLATIPHTPRENHADKFLIQSNRPAPQTFSYPLIDFNCDEESCRAMLRLALHDEECNHFSYALGFVGCQSHDGTSTVVGLFARQMALRSDSRILVVDTNIYNPQQHINFEAKLSPGFTDLTNTCSDLRCIQPTALPNIDILSTGNQTAGFPACKVLTHLLPILKASYNYIIFDLPPLQTRSPILHSSRLMDGVALLIEAEKTRWEVAFRAQKDLSQMQSNLLGVVLNRKRFHIPEWLYKRL